MNRTIIATAAALAAATTLFGSAANACISCEYVPEVVRSSSTLPHTGHYYSAAPYERKSVERAAVERSAPAKKRIVKSEPVAKKFDAAETAPVTKQVTKQAKSESSSISTAATEPAKAEPKAARNENSSISVASTEVAGAKKAEVAETTTEAAARPTDCKKFFPSVGMTLTVPCE